MLYNFQLLSSNVTLYVLYDPVTIDLKVSFTLLITTYLLIYIFNSKICVNTANKNKKLYTYIQSVFIKKLVKLQWKKNI